MKIQAVRHKVDNSRALRIIQNGTSSILPLGIAGLCTDERISGFKIQCTDCCTPFAVRDLNELGYCEDCACAGIEDGWALNEKLTAEAHATPLINDDMGREFHGIASL